MKPATLDYAKRPKRRTVRLAVLVAAAAVLLGGLLYWRAPIRAFLTERHQAWKFASSFDRARRTLLPDGGTLWTPDAGGVDADQLRGELLAASSSPASKYRNAGPTLVLFVRSGHTSGREWLAFACMTSTGLEVYSFVRDDRQLTGYDRLLETRQFFGLGQYKTGTLRLVAGGVSERDDRVVTAVDVNGGRNILEWSITAAPAVGRRSNMAYASQVIVAAVAPKTGWSSSTNWWPNTGDVVLVEGPPPAAEVAAVGGSLAISFVPDGRIAMLAPKLLALASPQDASVQTTPLPRVDRPEIVVFSPDGAWCYAGETSGDDFLVPTLGGSPVHLGESHGMPKPFFLDDRTLIVLDNTRLRRFEGLTGEATEEPKPAGHLAAIVRAQDVLAYTTSASPGVRVRKGERTYEIADVQGRHLMSLSPDGKWLALKGQSGISLFDVEAGVAAWEHDMNNDLHTARSRIKWSRDGTLGAAAGNRYVYVWSLGTPRRVARFPHGRTGYWPDVAFSEDGKSMAASAAGSTSIAYWPDLDEAIRPAG